jgi:hypothetical protein
MTRFALIPLAFFANACASADDAQQFVSDDAEEVRAAFDELEAGQDRTTTATATTTTFGDRVVRVAERIFQNDMYASGCEYVAAAAGSWRYYPANISLNVFDVSGDHEMELQGVMKWIDNSSGEIYTKGFNRMDNRRAKLEADWLHNRIEGDLTFSRDNAEYRFFGLKNHRGTGGSVIGAIVLCE